jgi:uncharacterized DUF497 family protein
MNFEWDESKSDRCWQERGFDFAFAARAFFDPQRQVTEDHRYAYGEPRYRLTGAIEGRLFVVAYTLRGELVRIISARKANQREVTAHENRQAAN